MYIYIMFKTQGQINREQGQNPFSNNHRIITPMGNPVNNPSFGTHILPNVKSVFGKVAPLVGGALLAGAVASIYNKKFPYYSRFEEGDPYLEEYNYKNYKNSKSVIRDYPYFTIDNYHPDDDKILKNSYFSQGITGNDYRNHELDEILYDDFYPTRNHNRVYYKDGTYVDIERPPKLNKPLMDRVGKYVSGYSFSKALNNKNNSGVTLPPPDYM